MDTTNPENQREIASIQPRRGTRSLQVLANLLALLAVLSLGYAALVLRQEAQASLQPTAAPAKPTATPLPVVDLPVYTGFADTNVIVDSGIPRLTLMHTTRPDFSIYEMREYEVKAGDTLFGIGEQFDLKPQTLMFGNYDLLYDDPHRLSVGQKLRILPSDGLLYTWAENDGLNGVAEFFKVTPEAILEWPGNGLNPDEIGDYSKPNISVGAVLFVPNGKREFVSWSVGIISRRDPAKARNVGPGSCGTIAGGATGSGGFVFPTINHAISGYHYDPSTNHNGTDFAGSTGNAVVAADGGVVVYAGWNDYGYGNMVVIDHGTGWQTLYAHLSGFSVGCGSSVAQGDLIAAVGSTGRSSGSHLHFELMSASGGKVNPMDYLQ